MTKWHIILKSLQEATPKHMGKNRWKSGTEETVHENWMDPKWWWIGLPNLLLQFPIRVLSSFTSNLQTVAHTNQRPKTREKSFDDACRYGWIGRRAACFASSEASDRCIQADPILGKLRWLVEIPFPRMSSDFVVTQESQIWETSTTRSMNFDHIYNM